MYVCIYVCMYERINKYRYIYICVCGVFLKACSESLHSIFTSHSFIYSFIKMCKCLCVCVCVCVCVCIDVTSPLAKRETCPGNRSSIPGLVIPKTQKMVLDISLLNTQHYKSCIKGKMQQFKERGHAHPYNTV